MICRFAAWGWFYSKLNIQLLCTVHLKNADFMKNAQRTENILIWWCALHSVPLVSADQCWSLRKLLFFFWLGAQHKKHSKWQLSRSKWHVFTPSDRTSDIIRLKEFLTIYSHTENGILFHLDKTDFQDLFLHFWSATSFFLKWILTCHTGKAWESNRQQSTRSVGQTYLEVSKFPFGSAKPADFPECVGFLPHMRGE